ncbi:MAG: FAD-dependent oxidoreductase [Candidatus Omnitrophota bacterium]
MNEINVTINGKDVLTQEGKTILEVVHENKIDEIPTLCHDGRIEPYGSCFLCVVEVQGMNRMVASCCTPVSKGMVITTNSEKVRSSRKTALELLLSNHYADCVGPCLNNCPANVDAQGYIALISMGKYEEAIKLIKKQNPLPLSIGRVCVRDCETACRRHHVDDAVAVNHLKRYVADIDYRNAWKPEVKPANGKRVAVVGGGPSGVTCAYYLTLEGYKVTIFEKWPRLGGMLMYGIPEYRLPKEILDAEINAILSLGIDVKTNTVMGKDFDIPSLFKDGFDAIYLAVGAQKASTMRMEHESDTEGIYGGVDFLGQLPAGIPKLNGTVVVVGGGNTAIDAARTSLRCGADKVKIVYRRGLSEMPAHPEEIHAAEAEGIELMLLTNPKAIVRDENKKLKGIVCLKMKLEEVPGERPKPVPMEGSDFEVPCDYLIGAIGQQVDTSFNHPENGVKLEKWGTIIANDDTLETSVPGVFAGGDAVTGPLTAVKSIAQGKQAATSIDAYIRFGKAVAKIKPFYSFKHVFNKVSDAEFTHVEKLTRNKMPELKPAERIMDMREVELGYTHDQAHAEPKRCLECGCSEYADCRLRQYADDFNVDIKDYLGETRKYKVDTRHPFIVMDPNKCINCGRCVRTCTEILKVSALGFVNRGFKAVVKPAMEKALLETNCIACGNCVDTCPTGALTEKFNFKVLGTLPKENIESVCNFCSIGCKINFKVIDNDIYFVSNSTESVARSINNGYLCVKGRFGHRYLLDEERLTVPSVKNKATNGFDEVSWEKAIDYTASRIKSIIDIHGADAVAVFGSPKRSNEELYLLQKFARVGLKTNNIGSFTDVLYGKEQDALDNAMGGTFSTASIEDIRTADAVIVLNGNLSEENLIMELKIKEAQKKNGTKLVLVNSAEIKLARYADLWIDSRKGSNTVLMNGLIRHIIKSKTFDKVQAGSAHFDALSKMVDEYTPERVTETTDVTPQKYQELLELVGEPGRKIVFVYNLDSNREKSAGDLKAIGNFMILTGRMSEKGNGIIILREYANSTGLMEMGVSANYLPGYVKPFETKDIKRIGDKWGVDLAPVFRPSNLAEKLMRGEIKAVLVFGEDPLYVGDNFKYFKGVEFMAVQDVFHTSTAEQADVVFPSVSFIEQDGTYTACDRRVQSVNRIIASKGKMENWQIIQALAEKFGMKNEYTSLADVNREIGDVNRTYNKPISFKDNEVHNATGKLEFSIYETEIKTYEAELPRLLSSENHFKFIEMYLRARN